MNKCIIPERKMIFVNLYFDESWYAVPMKGKGLALLNRKLSIYTNTLAAYGFVIE